MTREETRDDGKIIMGVEEYLRDKGAYDDVVASAFRSISALHKEVAELKRELELLRAISDDLYPSFAGWQDVNVALPEAAGRYLCAVGEGTFLNIYLYQDGLWANPLLTGTHSVDVTHWMPLPKLPGHFWEKPGDITTNDPWTASTSLSMEERIAIITKKEEL